MAHVLFKTLTILVMGTSVLSATPESEAAQKALPPLPEISIGKVNAPVTLIEYTSMTCPHCAVFHLEVLPQIKKLYVDTGKVRVIHRDYPGDALSLKATQISFCGGETAHLKMVTALFQSQQQWMFAKDPEAELKKIACENGLTKQQVESCLADPNLMDQIITARQKGQETYHIKATPTLVINGKIFPQALTLAQFQDTVHPILTKKVAAR